MLGYPGVSMGSQRLEASVNLLMTRARAFLSLRIAFCVEHVGLTGPFS